MNSVMKFELHFDKEDLTFNAGEFISGFLELVLNEDVKYKAICFEIKGYSTICWDGLPTTAASSSAACGGSFEVDDPSSAHVFREHCSEKCVMADKIGGFLDKDPVLQAGEHVFPFEVRIPRDVPSSFEGQYGRVKYECRGVIERSSSGFKASNKVILSRHDIVVLSALDLNNIPEASFKIEICKYKELGLCCTEGSLTIDWVVEKSGFIPTELVAVMGSIQNDSKHDVAGSSVSLIMVVEYRLKKRRLIDRVKIANMERGAIMSDDVTVWNDSFIVPSCPPSSLGRSKLIDISYELEFKVNIQGHNPFSIICNKTIYIGTSMLLQTTRLPASTMGVTATPAVVLTEPAILLPNYPFSSLQGSVVLTSPARMVNDGNFYGNLNSGFIDAYTVGTEFMSDILIESRPPPYAPGHNPEDFIDSKVVGMTHCQGPCSSEKETENLDNFSAVCIKNDSFDLNERSVNNSGLGIDCQKQDWNQSFNVADSNSGIGEFFCLTPETTKAVESTKNAEVVVPEQYRLEIMQFKSRIDSPAATAEPVNGIEFIGPEAADAVAEQPQIEAVSEGVTDSGTDDVIDAYHNDDSNIKKCFHAGDETCFSCDLSLSSPQINHELHTSSGDQEVENSDFMIAATTAPKLDTFAYNLAD